MCSIGTHKQVIRYIELAFCQFDVTYCRKGSEQQNDHCQGGTVHLFSSLTGVITMGDDLYNTRANIGCSMEQVKIQ